MTHGGPLAGLTVIELAGLGPGPFCGMMLADMGAEVIRVDRAGAASWSADGSLGRGRKSIAVDLKKPGAAELILRFVAKVDALIEGFRPGVAERLGLGPDVCLAANPRLVYGRMTGWGQDGPLASAPGHDINYAALSGMLWPIGPADRPPAIPLNLVGDFGGGGMMLALGITAGVLSARATGKGQVVDAAMVDGAAVLGSIIFGMIGKKTWKVEREANMLDGGAPFYGVYETADGRYVSIGSLEPQFYAALIRLLDLTDPRFAKQWDKAMWPDLRATLTATFKSRTRDAWCDLLDGSDVCFAPVLDPAEAATHPHNVARGTFTEVDGAPMPQPAPRFSATPTRLGTPSGEPGADTGSLLLGAGFSRQEIEAAKASGLIAGRIDA
ncbi:CaiB/BaiF CoA transferase family protein [Phreatobacter stygius]|uniref:CoA transferase n=1 Tax=Phreatobacter stygius TaxID=1940610 RepID=A0A4D7B0E8_9HYPH|nr:CaiB/BaiF CoA-transferase family protein [Phreatobacter stygius]QCI64493.1 CoA transferase [Phreatobacter stygius]